MIIREVPARFETSAGREFTTQAAAEKHQAFVDANQAFEEARAALGRLLAEREKTADGYAFKWTGLGDYYYVSPGWGGMPALSRVAFYVWSCRFEVDSQGRLTISSPDRRDDRTERWNDYRVGELYWREENAEKALLAAQEEWLAEQAVAVGKLRDRLEGKEPTE